MHDSSHSPMTAAEAASLRDAAPVDAALLQRIRAALVARHAETDAVSADTDVDAAADADTDVDAAADVDADADADQHDQAHEDEAAHEDEDARLKE